MPWRIAYSFVGNHEKAVETFTQCVEVDPALAACRSNLAMGHMSLGRMEAASAVIDASLDTGAISVSPGMLAVLVDLRRRDAFMVQAVNSPALRGWRNSARFTTRSAVRARITARSRRS